jgi:hypothetical protein
VWPLLEFQLSSDRKSKGKIWTIGALKGSSIETFGWHFHHYYFSCDCSEISYGHLMPAAAVSVAFFFCWPDSRQRWRAPFFRAWFAMNGLSVDGELISGYNIEVLNAINSACPECNNVSVTNEMYWMSIVLWSTGSFLCFFCSLRHVPGGHLIFLFHLNFLNLFWEVQSSNICISHCGYGLLAMTCSSMPAADGMFFFFFFLNCSLTSVNENQLMRYKNGCFNLLFRNIHSFCYNNMPRDGRTFKLKSTNRHLTESKYLSLTSQTGPWTVDAKMVVFRCPQVAWQFQTAICFPAVKRRLIQE